MNPTTYPVVYIEEEEIDEYELDDEGCYSYVRKGVREVIKAHRVHLVEPFIDVEST